MTLETWFSAASAVTAIIAAGLWIWSARTSEPAPENTSGVGALMGGYLISLNAKGERIDLHKTLDLQSRRNAWAAYAAAISAGMTAASVVCHIRGL